MEREVPPVLGNKASQLRVAWKAWKAERWGEKAGLARIGRGRRHMAL